MLSGGSYRPPPTNLAKTYIQPGEEPIFESKYDIAMNDFSKAISMAVRKNSPFRELLKTKADQQLDGDYDVLMKLIANTKVSVEDQEVVTRAGSSEMSVAELLDQYYPSDTKASGSSILEDLQNEYPLLQVSVPIHSEDWDPETFTPVVGFIPSDFSDSTASVIPGYDPEDNFVWIDAVNEPDEPVIIVGLSERYDENGEVINNQDDFPITYPLPENMSFSSGLLPKLPTDIDTPEPPFELTGVAVNGGIYLSWRFIGAVYGYTVYRKGPFDSDYAPINNVIGGTNRSFTDFNVSSGYSYSYYVTAVDRDAYSIAESEPSNYVLVQAPTVINALSHFEVLLSGTNVELNWNNDGDNNSQVHIEYSVPEFSTGYQPLMTFTGGTNYYFHDNPNKGTMTRYRAYRENSNGTSDAKYDFIYAPYRNSAANSPVYIKQIAVSEAKEVESWVAGKPEFYLKVLGVTSSLQTVELQRQMEFQFNKRRYISQEFSGRKAYDWRYFSEHDWYSSITFNLLEYDTPSWKFTFNASARYNYKKGAGGKDGGLEFGLGASMEVTFNNHGDECGNAYTNYFDPHETWIKFPNHGARILLSIEP